MRILVDMTSVVGGGGYEQSTAFLEGLRSIGASRGIEIVCAVRAGGQLTEFAAAAGLRCIEVKPSLVGRAIFSLFSAAQIIRRERFDAVYVAFGIGLATPRSCPQIINVAYPIICYPDSPYWSHLPSVRRLRTRIKSLVRALLIRRRATVIIAENEVMRDRLIAHAGLNADRVRIVPPIIGGVARALREMARTQQTARSDRRALRILLVTGADPHKNLWRLPAAVDRLHAKGIKSVTFAVTITEEVFRLSCLEGGMVEEANEFRREYFEFLGPTFGDALARQLLECDVIANVSDLESISNNFIEAAAGGKPMLVANRDFALSCVRTPYVVCEPHDASSLAAAIFQCLDGPYTPPLRSEALAIEAADRAHRVLAILEDAAHRRSDERSQGRLSAA